MKNIICAIVVFTSTITSLYSQVLSSQDDDLYMCNSYMLIVKDSEGKEVVNKPWGKNPSVFYDKFFKKYQIWYYNENGDYVKEVYHFVRNTEKLPEYKDDYGNYYYLADELSSSNGLAIIDKAKFEGKTILHLVVSCKINN